MPRVLQPDTRSVLKNRPKSKVYAFHLLHRQLDHLKSVSERTGIAVAEQIRRGIDLWLIQQERGR